MVPRAIVLDNSVMMAAQLPDEAGHAAAAEAMAALAHGTECGTVAVHVPTIFFLEVFAASLRQLDRINRQRDSSLLPAVGFNLTAQETSLEQVHEFFDFYSQTFASDVAPEVGGADLYYLIIARRLNATIVTLDKGLLRHDGPVWRVLEPSSLVVELQQTSG